MKSLNPFSEIPVHWIVNGLICTQNENRETLRAHLRIEGGRIAEITSSLPHQMEQELPDLIRKGKATDARGMWVLPGFVQTHLHLCQTIFKNTADDLELLDWLSQKIWPGEASHTEQTLRASAWLGIHELLTTGTTCILDMATVHHTPQILEVVEASGIRASVGKCLMDHPDTTPLYLRETTDRALAEALELYERWNGRHQDRIRISLAPRFVLSCTEPLLREIAQISQQRKILVHTHSSENQREVDWVRSMTGSDNVDYFHKLGLTHEHVVLAHCIWLSEREKRILAESKTRISHCPSSNLKLASGIAPIPELLRLGASVSIGADGAPCNNHLDAIQEIRLASLIQKPGHGPTTLRAQEVLDLATREGARALHWEQEVGSLEVGKSADFFLYRPQVGSTWSESPTSAEVASALVYQGSAFQVQSTWVQGEKVAENGALTRLSTQELLNQVRLAQRTLTERIRNRIGTPSPSSKKRPKTAETPPLNPSL